MSTNSSQIGSTPSATSQIKDNQFTITEILSSEIIRSSQSVAQFSETNMIPSEIPSVSYIQGNHNGDRRRELRRLRRQRQRQRRREQRVQQRQEEQAEMLERYLQRQQRRLLQYDEMQRQHRPWQYYLYERPQTYYFDSNGRSYRFAEYWEEKQLNEMEGFAILEQLASIQDEIEQEQQIDAEEKLIHDTEQEQCQNYEQSIEYEQHYDSIQSDIEQNRQIDAVQEIIKEENNQRNLQGLIQ